MGAQHLVISEAALTVESDGEEPAAVQLEEDRLAALPAEVPVAELPVEHAQDGGGHEEVAQLGRQLIEHVPGEELPHHPGARAQGAEDAPSLIPGAVAGGEVEEVQTRGPPVGAPGELGELVRSERLRVELAEELLDLPRPEAEVVNSQLDHAAEHAQPWQVEMRLRAGCHEHGKRLGRVLDEPLQRRLGSGAFDGVQIVDDQEGRVRDGALAGGGGILDAGPWSGEGRCDTPERRLHMDEQRMLIRVQRLDSIPGDGDPRPMRRAWPWRSSCRSRPGRRSGRAGAPRASRAGAAIRSRASAGALGGWTLLLTTAMGIGRTSAPEEECRVAPRATPRRGVPRCC